MHSLEVRNEADLNFLRLNVTDIPSNCLLMLVRGRRESLISSTMSVRLSKAGKILVNFRICPGNQDGGLGKAGIQMLVGGIMNTQKLRNI